MSEEYQSRSGSESGEILQLNKFNRDKLENQKLFAHSQVS